MTQQRTGTTPARSTMRQLIWLWGVLLLFLGSSDPGYAQGNRNPRDTKNYGKTPVAKPKDKPAPAPSQAAPAPSDPTNLLAADAGQPQPGPDGELPPPPPLAADSRLLGSFIHEGAVREGGHWALQSSFFQNDQVLEYEASLTVRSPGLWYWLDRTQGLYLVLLAERIFDGDGDYRYGASGLGTTVLSPTGVPVAAAAPRNPTDAFGGAIRHPGNRLLLVPVADIAKAADQEHFSARFRYTVPVGEEFLPGWYRFTAQFGIRLSSLEYTTLMGMNPAELALNTSADSLARYPLTAVKTAAEPTLPVAFFTEAPQGGALPDRLKGKLGLLTRQMQGPKTILPPFEPNGIQRQYSLEATIPFLQETGQSSGLFPLMLQPVGADSHLALSLETPDRTTMQLGNAHILGIEEGRLRTDRLQTTFAFSRFGKHVLRAQGQLTDPDGQTYRLDGTYDIHVAMPLDLRVATLPGMPAFEKESISLATRVYPPVPAKLTFTQWLAVHGSERVFRWIQDGKCNDAGDYVPELRYLKDGWSGPGQLFFQNDGEYRILAEASFSASNGWEYLGQWESASIVMPPVQKGQDDDQSLGLLPAFGGLGARQSPSLDLGLDFPLVAGELLFIPPGDQRFDPRLYGRGEMSLIDRRLLPASSLVDLSNGERGFLPTSATPQGYPAAAYPESRDRAGRLYAWAVAPGEGARAMVRDGDSDDPALLAGPLLDWPRGSAWLLYGGVSVYDHKLKDSAQGGYSAGMVVSDRVARFSVMPPGSGADDLLGRTAPFVLQQAIPPGMIVDQFRTYVPQMHIFPPRPGTLKVTMRRPDSTEEYFQVPVDARGFAGSPAAGASIQQPGVYTVSPQLAIDGALQVPPSYQFYVPNRKSTFQMVLNEAPLQPVDWGSAFTLSGTINGEEFQQAELFWTFLANGQVVTQSQQAINTPDFRLTFDLSAAQRVPGFDPSRPGHTGDITLFAVILTTKGELKTAHQRVVLRQGLLDYVAAGPAKRRNRFNIF